MWLIWGWEVGDPWCDARDSPAAEEKDKHPKWPGPRDPHLPMPRKWQGNVDTPPSRNATQRYCTKEEHHLSTPLPQHHVSSCCEPAGALQVHGLLLQPRCLPEHPCLQRCMVPLLKMPLSLWSKLAARWHITDLHLHGLTGSSCRMQTAFCKASELKRNLALTNGCHGTMGGHGHHPHACARDVQQPPSPWAAGIQLAIYVLAIYQLAILIGVAPCGEGM